MKASLVLLALLSFSTAWAAETCPNVEGSWDSYYNIPVRFKQNGCDSIVRDTGYVYVGGKGSFSVTRDFKLDGTPVCIEPGRCESARIDGDTLKFQFSNDVRRYLFQHGYCLDRGTTISKLPNGNLQVVIKAEACEDGFNGDFKAEFTPMREAN